MEIKILAPTNGQPLPAVQWNYAEVKQWLEDGLADYKGRVYDDANISEAKKDRANLNKLADVIAGKRKEMKSMYLEPYSRFETESKELEAMVKNQSAEIDAQVKAYENSKKEEKLNGIKEIYASMIGDLAGLVPYEKLHNPKWLNVTTSASSIVEELTAKIENIKAGLDTISKLTFKPEIAAQVKSVFLKDFNLTAALAECEKITNQRAELEKYEAAKYTPEYTKMIPPPPPNPQAETAPAEDVEIHTVAFRVWATSEQLNALKAFLNSNGIKYGRA